MIASFASHETQELWQTGHSRRYKAFERIALRKLAMINAAEELRNLRSPPGNRLEALHSDRAGQHSIRINDQFRVCFRWENGKAHDVEIVDYH